MDPEVFNQKLSVSIEIRIFEELKDVHLKENHKHPFIYLCAKCNEHFEDIFNDLVKHKNIVNQNYKESLVKIEEQMKLEEKLELEEKMINDGIISKDKEIL